MALETNKLTLCWPNHIEKSTITGGSYTTQRPVINAKNKIFAKKARSTDTTLSSTQAVVQIEQAKPVYVVSIAAHNFSVDSQIRIRVYSDTAGTSLLYDSGVINAWPAVYSTAQLEWEYDNFWFGQIDEEGRESFTPLFTHFLPEVQIAKNVTIEIIDEANVNGYVEYGRILVADAWQPDINVSYGINFGYDNNTVVERADDNTEYFDVKRQKRTMSFMFGRLDEQEAFTRLYSLQRQQGISKEILVAYNLVNTSENYQRMFIGRASQLDPISQPFIDNYEASLSLLEIT